jgi:hypothetical protein
MLYYDNKILHVYNIIALSPGPLSISQLLILQLFAYNIKSWEIERGPGDEATTCIEI